MPKVFISHAASDKAAFVKRLALRLAAHGVDVWYDEWSMRPGDSLRKKINEGISTCDYFLVVLSIRSVRSRWVKAELDTALIREIESRECVVIPVLVGAIAKEDIPVDLRGKVFLDLRRTRDIQYESRIEKLLEAVGVSNPISHYQPESKEPIRALANRFPQEPEAALRLARTQAGQASHLDLEMFGYTYADRLREIANKWKKIGNIAAFIKLHEGACELDEIVAERLRTSGSRAAAIASKGILAEAYAEAGELSSAETAYRRMVEELRAHSSQTGLSSDLEALSSFAFQLGDFEEELGHLQRAVDAFETVIEAIDALEENDELNPDSELRRVLANARIGSVAFRSDDFDTARKKLNEAIRLLSNGDVPRRDLADWWYNLGTCYRFLGKIELFSGQERSAIEACAKAKKIPFSSLGHQDAARQIHLQADIEIIQANAYRQLGEYSAAIPHARAGTDLWRKIGRDPERSRGDLQNLVLSLDCLARLLHAVGEEEEFEEVCQEYVDARVREKLEFPSFEE